MPDPASSRAAAVAALPPGACRHLTEVTEADIRPTPQDPWTHVALPSTDPRSRILSGLMTQEVLDRPDRLNPGSVRTSWQHLTPCPVCDLHAAPGPRVYGLFLEDHQAVEFLDDHHADRAHHFGRIQMFANAAHAQEQAELYADAYNRHNAHGDRRGVLRYTPIAPIVVPADPAEIPGRRNRSVGPDAELWLWDRPPTGAVHTWRPDRVLYFDRGTVVELTAQAAADRRPRPAPPETPYTPWQTVRDGNLELTWYAADPPLLVSVRDHTSREPAVRVTTASTTPLPDSERGLIVFGSHLGNRPPLSRITELAPAYAPLAPEPAPHTQRSRSRT
ncbi:hypothetical protein B4N89_45310 [Embleya scabrispora]|uniref:Uncharacterized protein n=2 Tax=Embleya scabrispora TaxID=159449 RepID=A0A1T3NIT9_9ACTN|nr:hypothetical protein B4N89_45310 [Embleya scabrispora]